MSLALIQKKLNAPKGQFNSFGKYYYRNCEDILQAVKEHLSENETIIISDDIHVAGDRVYIKATASFCIDDKPVASVSAFARESASKKGMDDAQLSGSTSSYARKYALNGLLLIDDNKDADHHQIELTDIDKSWISSIKGGTATLDQIEDSNYRKKIEGLIK